MTSFSLTKSDLLAFGGITMFAIATISWSQAKGAPLPIAALLSLCIALANVLVNAYYNAKRNTRNLQMQARIEAEPLVELKAELIRQLADGHKQVQALQQEVASLEAAAAIRSLDRDAVRSLLMAITRPTRRSVWAERTFGFVSGVLASLVASAVYDVARW